MVSFSVGREDLAACHLKEGLVGEQYRPLPEFDNQQLLGTLNFVTEALEGISPGHDELQDHDPADPASLANRLHQLNLETRGGPSGTTSAYAQIEQFSMKEREYGEGKSAFESYVAASLSRNHIVPTLWGDD